MCDRRVDDQQLLKYDPRTIVISGFPYEFRIRQFKSKFRDRPSIIVDLSGDTYACSCPVYVHNEQFCEHVAEVNEKNFLNVEHLYYGRLTDIHLEQLMENDARRDDTDLYDYERYFSNKSNFDLNTNDIKPLYYWNGYEAILARHHYAMEILLNGEFEELKCGKYKFSEKRDGVSEQYFAEFRPRKAKCYCSGFHLCTACLTCRHRIFCSCQDFVFGFVCRHCHAVTMLLNEKKRRPYFFGPKLGHYYTNRKTRFFYLGLSTRVRHNNGIKLTTSHLEGSSIVLVEDEDVEGKKTAYEVKHKKRIIRFCRCQCLEKCRVCGICRHDFKCSCQDYAIGYLCVHVHAASLAVSNNKNNYFNEKSMFFASVGNLNRTEVERLQKNHPAVNWLNYSVLEHRFLAYKHCFSKLLSEPEKRNIVRTRDGTIVMVGLDYELEDGDVRLNLESEGVRNLIPVEIARVCDDFVEASKPLDGAMRENEKMVNLPGPSKEKCSKSVQFYY